MPPRIDRNTGPAPVTSPYANPRQAHFAGAVQRARATPSALAALPIRAETTALITTAVRYDLAPNPDREASRTNWSAVRTALADELRRTIKANTDESGKLNLKPEDQAKLQLVNGWAAGTDRLAQASREALTDVDTEMRHEQLGQTIDQIEGTLAKVRSTVSDHSLLHKGWDLVTGGGAGDDFEGFLQGRLDALNGLRRKDEASPMSQQAYAAEMKAAMGDFESEFKRHADDFQDSEETWNTIDEVGRMVVATTAGIIATAATGGNVAAGFAAAYGTYELIDSVGDVADVVQGNDMYADGHTSQVGVLMDAVGLDGAKGDGAGISWDHGKAALKDTLLDSVSSISTAGATTAGMRISTALTFKIGGNAPTLMQRGLGTAIGGMGGQVVNGTGQISSDAIRLAFDNKLFTGEGGDQMLKAVVRESINLGTSFFAGFAAGAIPIHRAVTAADDAVPAVGGRTATATGSVDDLAGATDDLATTGTGATRVGAAATMADDVINAGTGATGTAAAGTTTAAGTGTTATTGTAGAVDDVAGNTAAGTTTGNPRTGAPGSGPNAAATPQRLWAPGLAAQFGNDLAANFGGAELTALWTEGRHMNQGEVIAASLGALPGTAMNIAMRPKTPDAPSLRQSTAPGLPRATDPSVPLTLREPLADAETPAAPAGTRPGTTGRAEAPEARVAVSPGRPVASDAPAGSRAATGAGAIPASRDVASAPPRTGTPIEIRLARVLDESRAVTTTGRTVSAHELVTRHDRGPESWRNTHIVLDVRERGPQAAAFARTMAEVAGVDVVHGPAGRTTTEPQLRRVTPTPPAPPTPGRTMQVADGRAFLVEADGSRAEIEIGEHLGRRVDAGPRLTAFALYDKVVAFTRDGADAPAGLVRATDAAAARAAGLPVLPAGNRLSVFERPAVIYDGNAVALRELVTPAGGRQVMLNDAVFNAASLASIRQIREVLAGRPVDPATGRPIPVERFALVVMRDGRVALVDPADPRAPARTGNGRLGVEMLDDLERGIRAKLAREAEAADGRSLEAIEPVQRDGNRRGRDSRRDQPEDDPAGRDDGVVAPLSFRRSADRAAALAELDMDRAAAPPSLGDDRAAPTGMGDGPARPGRGAARLSPAEIERNRGAAAAIFERIAPQSLRMPEMTVADLIDQCARSPELMRLIRLADRHQVRLVNAAHPDLAVLGHDRQISGTSYSDRLRLVSLDPTVLRSRPDARPAGDAFVAEMTRLLAHELAHAAYGGQPPAARDFDGQEAFTEAFVRAGLDKEGDARLTELLVGDELAVNAGRPAGVPGADAGRAVLDRYRATRDREDAARALGELFRDEPRGTSGRTYGQAFAENAAAIWNRDGRTSAPPDRAGPRISARLASPVGPPDPARQPWAHAPRDFGDAIDMPVARVLDGSHAVLPDGRIVAAHELFVRHDLEPEGWHNAGIALNLQEPGPHAAAFAQRVADIAGVDVIYPLGDRSPASWRRATPAGHAAPDPGKRLEIVDGKAFLAEPGRRIEIRIEEHLGRRLGGGEHKTVFRCYDKAVAIFRDEVATLGIAPEEATAPARARTEIDNLELGRRIGLPTLAADGPARAFGQPTLVHELGALSLKDIVEYDGGTRIIVDDTYLNAATLESIRRIRDVLENHPVHPDTGRPLRLNDFSPMIMSDGRLLFADPLSIRSLARGSYDHRFELELLRDVERAAQAKLAREAAERPAERQAALAELDMDRASAPPGDDGGQPEPAAGTPQTVPWDRLPKKPVQYSLLGPPLDRLTIPTPKAGGEDAFTIHAMGTEEGTILDRDDNPLTPHDLALRLEFPRDEDRPILLAADFAGQAFAPRLSSILGINVLAPDFELRMGRDSINPAGEGRWLLSSPQPLPRGAEVEFRDGQLFARDEEGRWIEAKIEDHLHERIGGGSTKVLFRLGRNKAIGLLQPGMGREHLEHEVAALDRWERKGFKVVPHDGIVQALGHDGIVYDLHAGSSLNVRGRDGSVDAELAAVLNERSLADLRAHREKLLALEAGERESLNDPEYLIGFDGQIYLSDPEHILATPSPGRQSADPYPALSSALDQVDAMAAAAGAPPAVSRDREPDAPDQTGKLPAGIDVSPEEARDLTRRINLNRLLETQEMTAYEYPDILGIDRDGRAILSDGTRAGVHELFLGADLGDEWAGSQPIVLASAPAGPELDAFASSLAHVAQSDVIVPQGETGWKVVEPTAPREDRTIEFEGTEAIEIGPDGQRRPITLQEALGPRIGSGAFKTVFQVGDKIVLVQRDGNSLPLFEEMRDLARLEEEGFPTVRVLGLTRIHDKPAMVADLQWKSSKEIEYDGETLDDSRLSRRSVDSLALIERLMIEKGVRFGDLELMAGLDGSFALWDVGGVRFGVRPASSQLDGIRQLREVAEAKVARDGELSPPPAGREGDGIGRPDDDDRPDDGGDPPGGDGALGPSPRPTMPPGGGAERRGPSGDEDGSALATGRHEEAGPASPDGTLDAAPKPGAGERSEPELHRSPRSYARERGLEQVPVIDFRPFAGSSPHEVLVNDELFKDWRYRRRPFAANIDPRDEAARQQIQGLADIIGVEILMPTPAELGPWEVAKPRPLEDPQGSLVPQDDGTLLLVDDEGGRRTVAPVDMLGEMLGVGGFKTAFRLHDKAAVVFRDEMNEVETPFNDPQYYLDITQRLKELGAPHVVDVLGVVRIHGKSAFVTDLYAASDRTLRSLLETTDLDGVGTMIWQFDSSDFTAAGLSSLVATRAFLHDLAQQRLYISDIEFLVHPETGEFKLWDYGQLSRDEKFVPWETSEQKQFRRTLHYVDQLIDAHREKLAADRTDETPPDDDPPGGGVQRTDPEPPSVPPGGGAAAPPRPAQAPGSPAPRDAAPPVGVDRTDPPAPPPAADPIWTEVDGHLATLAGARDREDVEAARAALSDLAGLSIRAWDAPEADRPGLRALADRARALRHELIDVTVHLTRNPGAVGGDAVPNAIGVNAVKEWIDAALVSPLTDLARRRGVEPAPAAGETGPFAGRFGGRPAATRAEIELYDAERKLRVLDELARRAETELPVGEDRPVLYPYFGWRAPNLDGPRELHYPRPVVARPMKLRSRRAHDAFRQEQRRLDTEQRQIDDMRRAFLGRACLALQAAGSRSVLAWQASGALPPGVDVTGPGQAYYALNQGLREPPRSTRDLHAKLEEFGRVRDHFRDLVRGLGQAFAGRPTGEDGHAVAAGAADEAIRWTIARLDRLAGGPVGRLDRLAKGEALLQAFDIELDRAERHFQELAGAGQPVPPNGLAAADMARLRGRVAAVREHLARVFAGPQSWEGQFSAQLQLLRLGRDLRDVLWNTRFSRPGDLDSLAPESRAYLTTLRDLWDSVVPAPSEFDRPSPGPRPDPDNGAAEPLRRPPPDAEGGPSLLVQLSYQVWAVVKLLGQQKAELSRGDFATLIGKLQAAGNRAYALRADRDARPYEQQLRDDIDHDLNEARAWLPEIVRLLRLMAGSHGSGGAEAEPSLNAHVATAIGRLEQARRVLEGVDADAAEGATSAAIRHIEGAIGGLRSYSLDSLAVPQPAAHEQPIVDGHLHRMREDMSGGRQA
ncbi:hypothetical protein ACFW16_16530 [Inquilinus sp. NPDC058860]|uniref:hypothetical protein n=1 Tax=Inquilinus sp. NPDC058860 TaxID=3346652 RepID=UPI0036A2E3F5